MMAKLGTHPLDVAKKRFQVSMITSSHMSNSRQAPILCIVDL